MLLEATTNANHSINRHSIQELSIYDKNTMEQCHSRFLYVNKLTLTGSFAIAHTWITNDLDRVISLKQLTQLTVECHLPFEQLLTLLHLTPNLHNLKLHSLLFKPIDFVSINEYTEFQSISNMNTMTTLSVSRKMILQEIQCLTILFPRLESLTINLHQNDVEPILQFLLSKFDKKNRDLSSLCILEAGNFPLQSEQIPQHCSRKRIATKLYLWW